MSLVVAQHFIKYVDHCITSDNNKYNVNRLMWSQLKHLRSHSHYKLTGKCYHAVKYKQLAQKDHIKRITV